MSVTLAPPATSLLPVPPDGEQGGKPHHWSRDEFRRAVDAGLFAPTERIELVDGELIRKVGENAPHSSGIRLSRRALELAFRDQEAFVSEQHPISVEPDSEPEPDLVVVRGKLRDYDLHHPAPGDVLLLVEVSRATLAYDRGGKQVLYANAGIAEYWVLNLVHRQLEVYRNPQGGIYRSITIYTDGDTVSPLAAPQAAISVADLLPTAE
jgi:Uma2 family endonuclease